MHFNPAQHQAIHQDPRRSHCLVLAGAGSGKTAVLVHRLIHLLELQYKPIWCITFTRQAALEMRERFGGLLQESSQNKNTLKKDALSNDSRNKVVLSKDSIRSKLEKDPDLVQLETFHIFARKILQNYSEEVPENLDSWVPLATKVLNERNLKDFLPSAILVDEFQDINPEQLEFCQALRVQHIFAVGDDDQAIYGFRGSSVEAILSIDSYFSPMETIHLNFNYRSRQSILDLANKLFPYKGPMRKKLICDREPKSPLEDKFHSPTWKSFRNSKQQNDWMIATILRVKKQYPQIRWNDIAILVRLNQLVEYYCEMLNFEDIPESSRLIDGVQVMTIHASKGLQFPVVFICELNEFIFPHFENFTIPRKFKNHSAKEIWRQERMQEEERLFYVAITRAESFLYLLHCRRRVWRAKWFHFNPSPFFKLKHTRRYQMVTWLKLKCFFMVNLFMVGRMIIYVPVLFQSTSRQEEWITKHSSKWAAYVLKQLRFQVTLEGSENKVNTEGRHLFVVSNHISWGDIPAILLAFKHKLGFVAKAELTRIPILHYWMRQIGCIFVNRKKHREAMRALQALEEKAQFTRIVLFPEGTRSKNGKLGSFKPGGLKIAWSLGALLQPIHIKGTRGSWEDRSDTATHQGSIKILPSIDLARLKEDGTTFDEFLKQITTILKKENGGV